MAGEEKWARKTSQWIVTRAAAGGQSSKIDEHDKSSGSDTGLNDSTRQLTDLRIQCIEFLSGLCCAGSDAERNTERVRENLVNILGCTEWPRKIQRGTVLL